jgi:hypothetical protein
LPPAPAGRRGLRPLSPRCESFHEVSLSRRASLGFPSQFRQKLLLHHLPRVVPASKARTNPPGKRTGLPASLDIRSWLRRTHRPGRITRRARPFPPDPAPFLLPCRYNPTSTPRPLSKAEARPVATATWRTDQGSLFALRSASAHHVADPPIYGRTVPSSGPVGDGACSHEPLPKARRQACSRYQLKQLGRRQHLWGVAGPTR